MQSERESIKRLTKQSSKVSCHYFIKRNGEIIEIDKRINAIVKSL